VLGAQGTASLMADGATLTDNAAAALAFNAATAASETV
jgi:hypothetical protein